MSVADKLLQVNQVKQDIKVAIETKGIPMTNVAFTEYANKILDIRDISYEEYALALYYRFGKLALFENAWQDMEDSETVLFDIPLALAAPNQEMGGMTIDLYVGTDGQLQALYDACVNETIRPPIGNNTRDVYYVNNAATMYNGDVSGDVGFPIPLYNFGIFDANDNNSFLIGDLTPLGMGLGLVLAKVVNVSIPNNNIVIQQGFEFENESGIIIPDSVTSIGLGAFGDWTSNNQPLVIPDSVTSIGNFAFEYWEANNQPLVIPNSVIGIAKSAFRFWEANNQPLVIPDSVIGIGESAFYNWQANNQPLTIPDSVTEIGRYAFYLWSSNNQPLTIPSNVTSIGDRAFGDWTSAKEFIMESETPPTIASNSFTNTNNAPIYVPDGSVDDYKTATNWVSLASKNIPNKR